MRFRPNSWRETNIFTRLPSVELFLYHRSLPLMLNVRRMSNSEDFRRSPGSARILAEQTRLLSGHRWRISSGQLSRFKMHGKPLILSSFQLCLNLFKIEFIEIATKLSAVVACRCSPTQKADVAKLIRKHTMKRVCCIGDGGNDVSMIQAADVGMSSPGS